jgi:hypothetical protein
MHWKLSYSFLLFLMAVFLMASSGALSFVTEEEDRTFILDQTGERWDVTQAKSLGFRPELFQYGIGRDAFTPLDDSHLSDGGAYVHQNLRIIGIADDLEAHAYSVSKLWRHEIANSKMGSKPIAVGY